MLIVSDYSSYASLICSLLSRKKELNMSNTYIAEKTGISEKTIGGIFNGGKSDVKLSTILLIADVLGCSLTVGPNE